MRHDGARRTKRSAVRAGGGSLPHDIRDIFYDGERPTPLPIFESREGVINLVREIDESLALAVRMEDQ